MTSNVDTLPKEAMSQIAHWLVLLVGLTCTRSSLQITGIFFWLGACDSRRVQVHCSSAHMPYWSARLDDCVMHVYLSRY